MDEVDALVSERTADALDALLLDYDQGYKIEVTQDGEWRWRRLDGLGGWMTATGPDELHRQVCEDHLLKPVMRPSAPGGDWAMTPVAAPGGLTFRRATG